MPGRLPLTDKEGEIRELTEADFKAASPFSELPEELQGLLRRRGPQKAPTKVSTTIRFDRDVLSALKATGRGWQTRVNDAMRDWIKTHSAD